MRMVIQRVSQASVTINHLETRSIGKGLVVLLGIEHRDDNSDVDWLVHKLVQLRIFSDSSNKMNLSLLDIKGELLIISQFTLMASTKKGNRPSFIDAANPALAIPLYERFIELARGVISGRVSHGEFGADMKVNLINDGPVTILIDSKNRE
ncbi:MAG: D-aminoacyl-tRNA deacylase [Flavobacteriaceae bacterium]|nr:D-aminoacyl-tRNA deacylase [Flavobacteriaceae bacterium]